MPRPSDRPRHFELDLTMLELSMLVQALILMLPQIERTINAATGEEVTTQDLIMKLVAAGMVAESRRQLDELTGRETDPS
jgi:hypothetical protein